MTIFEDDVDLLQHLLATQQDEGNEPDIYLYYYYFPGFELPFESNLSKIEVSALFGSVR